MRPPATIRRSPPTAAGAAFSCLFLCSALFLSGCGAFLGSSGSCGQVVPAVEPSRAAPGEAFVLSGGGFGGGCDDSNMPDWPDPPQQDILIEMRQGGKTWELATVDAGGPPDYAVEATLEVPKGAKPGGAFVVVHRPNQPHAMKVPFEVLPGGEPG